MEWKNLLLSLYVFHWEFILFSAEYSLIGIQMELAFQVNFPDGIAYTYKNKLAETTVVEQHFHCR